MSNKTDYLEKLEKAKALDLNEIKTPYMPMGIFLQEAEDLHHTALKDKEALMAAGLAEDVINDLNITAGATREAQSIWMQNLQTRKDAEQRWKDESPAAFDLRDQLLHTFRYAFRASDDLLSRLTEIEEGGSNADMIQDLNDLAVMGLNNPEALAAINFDPTLNDKAAKLSADMADLLAMANGDKNEDNESLNMRNRMYTLLKNLVDEVRQCGKYVFWRDEKRLKLYASRHNRMTNARQVKKEESGDSTY